MDLRWVLVNRLHYDWVIFVICLGFLLGAYVSAFVTLGNLFFVLVFGLLGLVVVFWKRFVYLVPVMLLAGASLGLVRANFWQAQSDFLKTKYGQIVTIEGVVKEDVDVGTGGQNIIRLKDLKVDGTGQQGVIWASFGQEQILRGDEVALSGKLEPGFGSFVGVIYRAKVHKITQPEPGDVARRVRDWFADAVRVVIPEPQASLGIGYLVGQRRALPPDLSEALQIAGLTHVVVASGYNLTILVRFARRFFMRVSKHFATLTSAVMIASFIAITGASPSMARAGLVAGLSLAVWYYGRQMHPLIILVFAAAVTVAFNPSYIRGDVGWQLSFAAFAGVMIIAPLLQKYFFGEQKPSSVRQVLGETVSAQIATAPILIFVFGQFSNVAVIANLLVLPFIPLAMLLTFLAGVGSLFSGGQLDLIGLPAQWLLGYMVWVAQFLADQPWALTNINFSLTALVACYVIMSLACVYLIRKTGHKLREVNLVE